MTSRQHQESRRIGVNERLEQRRRHDLIVSRQAREVEKAARDLLAGSAGHPSRPSAQRHLWDALRAALNGSASPEQLCRCGHTRHWHGQESGATEGSGECEFAAECKCREFIPAPGTEEARS